MIVSIEILRQALSECKNPDREIEKMVESRELISVKQGWFATEDTYAPLLADILCHPSYLSFESALSYYGLIPEAVYALTSATFQEYKSKTVRNDWGTFYYYDVPAKIYPYGVTIQEYQGEYYKLASPEKALCDKLYQVKPSVDSPKDLFILLTENLRIEEEDLANLTKSDLRFLSDHYPDKNVRFLYSAICKYCPESSHGNPFIEEHINTPTHKFDMKSFYLPEITQKEEELYSKKRAIELWDQNLLDTLGIGTYQTLQQIHHYLFQDVFPFAGETRTVNLFKGTFRFVPVLYLKGSIQAVESMPQSTWNEILEKYVEMNVVHPFREGNGRAMRIWLNHILSTELKQVIDWSQVDKEKYLRAMECSPVDSMVLNVLLSQALTSDADDREVYLKGIEASYDYEGHRQVSVWDIAT